MFECVYLCTINAASPVMSCTDFVADKLFQDVATLYAFVT